MENEQDYLRPKFQDHVREYNATDSSSTKSTVFADKDKEIKSSYLTHTDDHHHTKRKKNIEHIRNYEKTPQHHGQNCFPTSNKEQYKSTFKDLIATKGFSLLFYLQCHFISGLAISILAPFLPAVAEKHDMPLPLLSLTFSLFPISGFILGPLIGFNLNRIGPKFVFLSGLSVLGSCSIIYGVLEKCPSGTAFTVLALSCRAMEATGFTAYVTAALSIASNEFPDHSNIVFSMMQASSEVGLMIGPVIGGALYTIGGFGAPFYAQGVVVLINVIYFYFRIPDVFVDDVKIDLSILWRLVCSPTVIFGILNLVTSGIGISFLETTLANHLNRLQLSPFIIGFIFFVSPAVFAVTAPLYANLNERIGHKITLTLWAHVTFTVGYFFIGPSVILPFLNFNITNTIIGLLLLGSSFGCSLVVGNKFLINGASDMGWSSNINTFGTLTGLMSGSYFLGNSLGPFIGASNYDEKSGFALEYTAIGCVGMVMIILTICYFYILPAVKLRFK